MRLTRYFRLFAASFWHLVDWLLVAMLVLFIHLNMQAVCAMIVPGML